MTGLVSLLPASAFPHTPKGVAITKIALYSEIDAVLEMGQAICKIELGLLLGSGPGSGVLPSGVPDRA
jgi:hypothetical protein